METHVKNLVALLALGLALVAACSSGAGTPTSQPANNTFAPVLISFPVASGTVTGHVGDKLTFLDYGGDPIDVTLVKVIDPALPTDAQRERPAGAHWVGAEVAIDTHSAIGADSEVLDATASDGTALTTDDVYKDTSYPIEDMQGCTEAIDDAPSGTYCVSFVVPDGMTVTKIGARVGGAEIHDDTLVAVDQATWTVP